MLKTQADERYITLDDSDTTERSNILRRYNAARRELEEIDSSFGDASFGNTRMLLDRDIEYRIFLLENKLGFWGGARTLRPVIPIVHMRRLQDLLLEFEMLAGEIDVRRDRTVDQDAELLKNGALAVGAETAFRSAERNQDRFEIVRESERRNEATFLERINALREERKLLLRRQEEANASAKAMSATLTKAIVAGASGAAGLPGWANTVISGKEIKDIRDLAGPVVDAYLVSESGKALLSDLRSRMGDDLNGLVEVVEQGHELKKKLNEYNGSYERVAALIRQPTLETLVEAGADLSSKIPGVLNSLPEPRRSELKSKWKKATDRWEDVVAKIGPVFSLVEVVREPSALSTQLRGAIGGYLDEQLSRADLRQLFEDTVATFVRTKAGNATAFYAEMLRKSSSFELSDQEARLLLDSYIRGWAIRLLETVPNDKWAIFQKRFKAESKQELARRFAQTGLAELPGVKVANMTLTIYESAGSNAVLYEMSLRDVLGSAQVETLPVIASDAVERELRFLANQAGRIDGQVRKQLLDAFPFEQIESALRRVVPKGSELIAWKKIFKQLPSESQQKAQTQVAEKLAGMQIASDLIIDKSNSIVIPENQYDIGAVPRTPVQSSPGVLDPVAKKALLVAFPATGAALAVAETFIAYNSAIDELKETGQRLVENTREEAAIVELAQRAHTASELAQRDIEISRIRQDGARRQYDIYRFVASEVAQAGEYERQAILRRRPLFFYISERLREEFDLLDQSIQLWAGASGRLVMSIKHLILEDPQNIRLALDSDIHLFDWLRRDGEGLRTDVDALLAHWRQLVRLARDTCGRIGCDIGTPSSVQAADTGQISLCSLMSAGQKQRFRQWVRNRDGSLTLDVFFDPNRLPIASWHANVRVIEVRLAGRIGDGNPQGPCTQSFGKLVPFQKASVTHPGPSYVPRGDGTYFKDLLLPHRSSSFMPPEPFDIEALSQRWNSIQVAQRRSFEGYGLFSLWRFELPREIPNLNDVIVRVAYQYVDPQNILTESQFITATKENRIDPYQWEVVIDPPVQSGLQPLPVRVDPRVFLFLDSVAEKLGISKPTIGDSVRPRRSELEHNFSSYKLVRRCKPIERVRREVESLIRADIRGARAEKAWSEVAIAEAAATGRQGQGLAADVNQTSDAVRERLNCQPEGEVVIGRRASTQAQANSAASQ
ncbi:hypothetical protein E0E54_19720 [Azotobacter chroococcum]|uniref:hypothetical protein n=1 Tax=Azotobacter chroococcum TaxID=353 RepID=UPI00103CD7E7|nr:hypothetical protein [Azotobacter chroococcum]TBW32242.1 hypothetical protein E0E54_19720 [Azotobacter chroococcum]